MIGRPSPEGSMRCSFCKLDRAQVQKLLAGPDELFVCDACVRYSMDLIDREGDPSDRLSAMQWTLLRELGSLPPRSPRAVVRKLVRSAIELCDGDAVALRSIASAAWSAGDPDGGVLALRRIDAAERTPDDVISEAVHHDTSGAYEVALALLDTLDPAALSPVAREVVPLHRAVMRLAGELAPVEEARDLEGVAITFLERLPGLDVDASYATSLMREALFVRARAAKLAGELTRAEVMVREHLVQHERDAEAWSLLFDIHTSRGEHDHARVARTKALEHAHPEGAIAERLRDPTLGPFR